MAEQERTRVLLTGFEPFGGETVNPSAEAVTAAVRAGRADPTVELASTVLPVELARALPVLDAAVAGFGPDIVVAFGQAGGRYGVTPERIAVNLEEAAEPDNSGALLTGRPVVPGGPAAYLSTLPVPEIVAALHGAGIPASTSTTAGAYLCNHVFYGLLHRVAGGLRGPSGAPLMTGFVHVPYAHAQVLDRPAVASLAQATIDEAVQVVVRVCVAAHRARSALSGQQPADAG
jgi:pyroglutamyl-peptidase